MLNNFIAPSDSNVENALPIYCVQKSDLDKLPENLMRWAKANGFAANAGDVLTVPDTDGAMTAALLGIGSGDDSFVAGALAKVLPDAVWHFAQLGKLDLRLATIGFLLGAYRFENFKSDKKPDGGKLLLDPALDRSDILRQVQGTYLARDLINLPTNEMGPDKIEQAARDVAKQAGASISVVEGDALLAQNFPMIHAVGRAGAIAPRLIDMQWGDENALKLTLVGKGVAFDTGGLDIKPASGMRNMKKDMGGSANVLGLAQMLMDAKINVRLRVLIPAVENSIAGNAFRPGDILTSRQGTTVEIGNTDAEGRLVLADALTLACEETPDLVIDMATLTGAARVALGPELPPFYTDSDELASEIEMSATAERDPLWRMPLWKNYHQGLASTVADLNNVTTDGFAGSITAALFLQRFVKPSINWAHFDIFGWSPTQKPHAQIGGEAQAIRALFATLVRRYGAN